jgi:hypothetical protein
MTEEKFEEILKLKEQIGKVESNLSTINHLIRSKNLNMKIEGVSDCKFKVSRYINLSDDEIIKSILEKTRMDLKERLYLLNEEFSKK